MRTPAECRQTERRKLFCAALCCAAFAAPLGAGPGTPAAADAASVPVIDIHAHVFNLRYLPVRGILVARGVPKVVAEALDRLLVGGTRLADLSRPADELRAGDVLDVGAMEQEEARRWILGRLQPVTADGLPDARPGAELLTPRERRALRKYVAPSLARADRLPGELADADLVAEALEVAQFDERGDTSYPRFLATLMQDEVSNVRAARRDYPRVDLFVHHLMDMERPYDDPPALANGEQIARLPQLAALFPGRLVGTVAFDPFRRDGALAVVRSAIDSGRAVGVKFYPPSGYRAGGNGLRAWPPKPSLWKFALRAQWTSRYGGWTGSRLDEINRGLFAWAAGRGVPILAHCTPEGFEAFAGSGLLSDPAHWRAVLRDFPNLRLVLAHAGGGDGEGWFSTGAWTGEDGFDQRAWDLATRFENVYLDFSYASEVLDDARLAALRDRLVALLPKDPERSFALGHKLVYGSDWHMVASLDRRREIFDRLWNLFSEPALRPWRARFFAGNAARALRLDDLAASPLFDAAQRAALADLAARVRAAEAAP